MRKRTSPDLEQIVVDVAAAQTRFLDAVGVIGKLQRELNAAELEADTAGQVFDAAVERAQAAGWPKGKPIGLLTAVAA